LYTAVVRVVVTGGALGSSAGGKICVDHGRI
jgi:hypothetical protein